MFLRHKSVRDIMSKHFLMRFPILALCVIHVVYVCNRLENSVLVHPVPEAVPSYFPLNSIRGYSFTIFLSVQ